MFLNNLPLHTLLAVIGDRIFFLFFLDMKPALYIMRSYVVMENVMPIWKRDCDKNNAAVQQADIARMIIERRPFLQAS